MNRVRRAPTREERRQELMALWEQGRAGQSTVLALCHRVLDGKMLNAGMSIFEVIIDHEFGSPADGLAAVHRHSA